MEDISDETYNNFNLKLEKRIPETKFQRYKYLLIKKPIRIILDNYIKLFGKTYCYLNFFKIKLGFGIVNFYSGIGIELYLFFITINIALTGEVTWWLGKYYISFFNKIHYSPKEKWKNNTKYFNLNYIKQLIK